MAEFHDRPLALKYIRERGYASHSSLKKYIAGEAPTAWVSSEAQIFGNEFHLRFLEKRKQIKLTKDLNLLCNAMLNALATNRIAQALLKGAVAVEKEFKIAILGVVMLGYFDIRGKNYVADLKTTKQTTLAAFVKSLDFMQAAIYLRATGFKDFYYIGITKEKSPKVFVFNVRNYPELLAAADKELVKWLKYLKKELKNAA